MIRQMCPHCLKLAELPDSAAGTSANCPNCAKSFSVPGAYAPAVDASAGPGHDPRQSFTPPEPPKPAPPPGLVIPAAPTPPPGLASASPPVGPVSDGNDYGFTLAPQYLAWIPVSCVSLILLLTVLPWVGSYPGGTAVYSQYPWQAIFGNFARNVVLEDLLKDEAAIEAKIGWNFWLLLYLPLLMLTVFLAWVERAVQDPKVETVPPLLAWLPNIWPVRYSVLSGVLLLLGMILLVQSWQGFSLEVAIKKVVEEKYAEEVTKAMTYPAKQRVTVQIGQELASKGVQGTSVLSLVLLLHLVAVVVMALRWWIDVRGPQKPLPWVGVRF